ncbi:hypothetical protein A2533_00850 [Candidatus Falkowbacteria bacterium RIFOXYD2_FULL_35_9]|uniref:Haloacid dehalogenase n=1 Tax=Candidatus Falkowbacteria bacterium RIFOXYC2_FULL_36_12 TaxID=1798002 RepID=A0A1F5T079_9BACT|nr:MAG: hypothetical protein A2300_01330 [Candidatus Falkowbacteria bacterium RIFOXYB2_FULL_35_7]OGF31871.1 MAG: hypothetical protein A2478_05305 [Candidatus Falkowbacteria bacterium RIFOXYC2_FULL_36_12]OGF33630.1 MAG: hypothetical protein A2223_03120 [Candidatus Falkowbacteria bacterium RIFOXYA2_FULL_35_8]OGF45825.1 MAG: hypothetical protein A2533_00850 [Candidatus Falkowbacteria bacterium RIFOXYD2_FULL_35_9]
MRKSQYKGVIFFDIDGTLYRWQIFLDWVYAMLNTGILNDKYRHVLDNYRKLWENRQDTFDNYLSYAIQLLESNLKGLNQSAVEAVLGQVVEKYHNRVYRFTRELLQRKQAAGWYICFISASPEYAVKLFADKWGANRAYGTTMEVKDGFYSGVRDVVFNSRKADFVTRVLAEINSEDKIPKCNIWAVGDTESDRAMLGASCIGLSICFNPNAVLYQMAIKNSWEIVYERKDVITQSSPNPVPGSDNRVHVAYTFDNGNIQILDRAEIAPLILI